MYGGVSTRREQPRLIRVPGAGHDADAVLDVVAVQDLDGDDQRVLHQVVVDAPVEHVHLAVIGRRRKQRVPPMVPDTPDGARMVLERLERPRRQV